MANNIDKKENIESGSFVEKTTLNGGYMWEFLRQPIVPQVQQNDKNIEEIPEMISVSIGGTSITYIKAPSYL